MAWLNRMSAVAAITACASLCATPAAAVELPRSGPAQVRPAYDGAVENVEHRRRYRDDGIDAGDVIAGVLILGGIAAVASAASRSRSRAESYPTRYPYPDRRYREPVRSQQGSGMDRAVDMCVNEIERGRDRVASVDSAARTGEGWFVSGEVEDGAPFTCRIDNDGRIGDVRIGDAWNDDRPSARDMGPYSDNQYGDDVYYRARAGQPGAAGPAEQEPYYYAR